MTATTVRSYRKHPDFFLRDGNMALLVEDHMMFNIHQTMIEIHSEGLKELMQIPEGVKSGTEATPIILSSITLQQFEALCVFLYSKDYLREGPVTESFLVSLFEICDFLISETIRPYCMKRLLELDLPDSRLIALSQRFFITDVRWTSRPLRHILDKSLSEITAEDWANLGPRVTIIVLNYHAEVEKTRKFIASFTPGLTQVAPKGKCTPGAHGRCKRVWHEYWQNVVAKKINHPESPVAFEDIRDFAKHNALKISGIYPACRLGYLAFLDEPSVELYHMKNISLLFAAINALQALCRR